MLRFETGIFNIEAIENRAFCDIEIPDHFLNVYTISPTP